MARRTVPGLVLSVLFLFAASHAQGAYSPASTNGWFPIAGRGPAAGNAQIRTDIWLFNPDPSAQAHVTLVFHPALPPAPGGPAVTAAPIVLFPHETKFFGDVTAATLPAGDGNFGAIEWTSDVAIMGTAHKYVSSVAGTAGGTYGATPSSESMGARASAGDTVNVLRLFGLHSGDASFATALDLVNTSAVPLPVDVKVVQSPSTAVLSTTSYTVAPRSLLRVGNPFTGIALDDTLQVTVGVREGT
ncbi:MAG: hypothetical protein M3S32_09075, partial [Acidobacteriota bacterium]|nr:hypothetical protein [Acidobacteriota bacterium]